LFFYDPINKTRLTGSVPLVYGPSFPFGASVLAFSETDIGSLMWAGAYSRTEPIVVKSLVALENIDMSFSLLNPFDYENFIKDEAEIENATPFRNMFYDEIRQVIVIINSVVATPDSLITIRTYSTDGRFTKLNEVTFNGTFLIGSAFHSESTDQYILVSGGIFAQINYINPNDLSLNFTYVGGSGTTFNSVLSNPIVNINRNYALGNIGTSGAPKRFARVPLGKRTQDDAVQLKDIVDDISNRAGLSQGEIDTSAMTDSVKGYVITKQAPARAAIEPLLTAYFYNPVESST
jgi:hypothetical protein